jgi:hypothetical protein
VAAASAYWEIFDAAIGSQATIVATTTAFVASAFGVTGTAAGTTASAFGAAAWRRR